MTGFINKFKIPTLLGIGIVLAGIIIGLYLVLREQVFLSQAAPGLTPQNITFTNISDNSITIFWRTNAATPSFITFGQGNPAEQTVLDDRDAENPKPHSLHYVTLKNLLPKTNYQFKIISGKLASEIYKFETATPLTNQTGFTPIIGSVVDNNNPINDGIVYLSIQDAYTQSALIKTGGNFLIPLSQILKSDLSDLYSFSEDSPAKLTILSEKGDTAVLFKLKANSTSLPPVKLGQDLDLTLIEATPEPTPSINDLDKYDLNNDGKLNAADYAILSSCQNKLPTTFLQGKISCTNTDINKDGKIDRKDLDLMSQKLTDLGAQ